MVGLVACVAGGAAGVHDPDNALPFANLVLVGTRKRHGIRGSPGAVLNSPSQKTGVSP